MNVKQQSGFGVIPIVLIVAAIAVLGYVGYRIYTAQTSRSTTSSIANNQTSPTSSQPSSATPNPATQADPNAGYVVIKEWNVRFKPVSGLNGVTTSIVSSTRPNAEEVMFMTPQMSAVNIPGCNGQAPGSRPLGATVRTKTAQDMTQHDHDQFLKQIGDYFYYYYQPAELCDTDANSNTIDNLQNTTINQIKDSLKSLEAAK